MERISKGLYLGSIYGTYVVTIILTILGFIMLVNAGLYGGYYYRVDQELVTVGVACMFLACIPGIFSVVMWCILTHRLWSTIQGESSRTTPGQAVGFMFIPLFNIYWMYQAIWGWSVDYNKHIKEKNIVAPPVSEGVGLAWCILGCVGIIPFVGYLTMIPQFILMIIWHSQSIDAANELIDKN